MIRLIRILLLVIPLYGFVVNPCYTQITYKGIENLYGLAYFLFRNEQMVFNKKYIIENDIKSITVRINYNEVELKSIYIYKKDGNLVRIKLPYPRRNSKKQQFKSFKYENCTHMADNIELKDSVGFNSKSIEFLNNRVTITQYIIEDTIRKEILAIKEDSIIFDHYYCMGIPLKTEVNVLSKKNEWFYFNYGLNIFNYNYKNGLLVSIISDSREDFQVVYNYCYY